MVFGFFSLPRSVLCNDPDISFVPTNFPLDTSKLRIEKTAITRISSQTFHYLTNLEFLWMSFNSLSSLSADSFRGLAGLDELRLDGNALTSFPWEALTDMPHLRLLDLHNNRIMAIPSEATTYIRNLTYLDLSSNSLTTMSTDVLGAWLSVKPTAVDTDSSKMILGRTLQQSSVGQFKHSDAVAFSDMKYTKMLGVRHKNCIATTFFFWDKRFKP